MIVVKLGGSLEKTGDLKDCLDKIERRFRHKALIIVPGGGSFADQVRHAQKRWQFDDETAHCMALLAMRQMGRMIHGLMPEFQIIDSIMILNQHQIQNETVIWSPDPNEIKRGGIQAGWNVTSDSLAAWLANTISADELIVVKSAKIDPVYSLTELAGKNVVDAAFIDFINQSRYQLSIINKQDL